MHVVSLFKNGRYQQTVFGSYELVIVPTLKSWDGEWAEGALDSTWWYSDAKTRKRLPCTAMLDGMVLRDVQPGSVVMIEGEQYECPEGGNIDLSFQFPGTYEVTVSCWPYLDGSYTVENPPPTQ
ncbi:MULTISPECIES: hypothetical protein [Alcaligenes]|uniref:Uncharacterized protein n=1 Tax=Alcaligenes phenolicus TaxID=232846 RepID=A0ABV2BDQ0_9BURK|nr:hypothetical protein [Alcaligenes faecalis]UUO12431.1 hypothetical protein M6D76_07035 [Alcaligenes faecalis]